MGTEIAAAEHAAAACNIDAARCVTEREDVATVPPRTLRAMLDDGNEIAVLDVREEGVFGRDGHLVLASNLPLSRLEILAPRMVPRRATRIVLCDGNEGLAQIAAARLVAAGYTDVHILEGGTLAWQAAGYRLYDGLNTYSKAFAEHLAHARHTPQATVADLYAWRSQGRDVRLLDCRPAAEYRKMAIPGSLNCPGMGLPYGVHEALRQPHTTVVVNCAGRTRSLMGVQTLLEAGMGTAVYALSGGTMSWALAGGTLEQGRVHERIAPSREAVQALRESAQQLAARHGISHISLAGLQALRRDTRQSVYLFDIRSPEEYAMGHMPGAFSIEGAQLVHTLDAWAAVRRSAIVLIDDDGARATLTAVWIQRMGWHDVCVLDAPPVEAQETGSAAPCPVLGLERIRTRTIQPAELAALLDQDRVCVVDVDSSRAYRTAHIPGAWHALRSRLARGLASLPAYATLVLTSEDSVLAKLASAETECLGDVEVLVLEGGTRAWADSGLPVEAGASRPTGPDDDTWLRAHEQRTDPARAMKAYLQWEEDLVGAVAADEDFRFRNDTP
jgi:rhodanese-related sulfurtransferase